MTITMLDVGQGLAVLIQADGNAMLYDGGGRDTSSYVVSYLEKHDASRLDYLVASHYDADHISGLVGCLYQHEVRQVICPDYQKDTKIYTSFRQALADSGAKEITPVAGDEYPFGYGRIEVLAAPVYTDGEDNNSSIVLRITYGSFHCILSGDAEWQEEADIVASGRELASDVYVAGHHGSAGSSSRAYVEAIWPKAALISCGRDNEYGHPSEKTLSVLEDCMASIYRTDLQGEIICNTDGKNGFAMNVEPVRHLIGQDRH